MRMSDWSADVCSSDLPARWQYRAVSDPLPRPRQLDRVARRDLLPARRRRGDRRAPDFEARPPENSAAVPCLGERERPALRPHLAHLRHRSEERRVGKKSVRTVRLRWYQYTKKK